MHLHDDLTGKIALIAGGAGSIGAATARRLADNGATVVIGARSGGSKVVADLPPGGHMTVPLDVADTHSLKAAARHLTKEFGKVDILVNAAGYTTPVAHADLEALDDALIDDLFKVNWRGQFATIREMAQLLRKSGDGLIVSISSISAITGIGSSIAYCAAKAGIEVMTVALARALAPTIRVLTVSPGVVDTGFVPGRGEDFNVKAAATTPLGRIGTAEDIADAVLACATRLRFSTGHTIRVDGGRAL